MCINNVCSGIKTEKEKKRNIKTLTMGKLVQVLYN